MPVEIRMPRLSDDTSEQTLVAWLKREGDPVRSGEALFMAEVDKVSHEVLAESGGTLSRILVPEGARVDVGQVLGLIAPANEAIAQMPMSAPPESGTAIREGHRETMHLPDRERRPISPAARRLALELVVDLESVRGTGSDGLVTEKDVRTAADARPSGSSVPSEWLAYSGIRRTTGERMALSRRTAADVTTVAEVDVTEVNELRQRAGVSYTAFVVKAAAMALEQFPIMNSSLEGDRIHLKKEINIGVAVAGDSNLVVPVVRDVNQLECKAIESEIEQMAAKARSGHLEQSDMRGSTFTVTNSGAFGSLIFTPIINYPEAAILGMGKAMETPVVRDGQIVVRRIMYLCLSYDHRIIDGATAVQFLQRVKRFLEEPHSFH